MAPESPLEAIIREGRFRPGYPCTAGVALDSLAAEHRAELGEAVLTRRIRVTQVGRWLRDHGHTVPDSALQRHYRGACQCPAR